MAAKYDIIFTDGKETIKGLSFDEAVEYKMKHIKETNYDIVEKVKGVNKQTEIKGDDEVSRKKKKDIFMSTLSESQRERLRIGGLELSYSKEIGYYLKVIHSDKPLFSVQEQNKKREDLIKVLLKGIILENCSCFVSDFEEYYKHLSVTQKEVDKLLKEIIR